MGVVKPIANGVFRGTPVNRKKKTPDGIPATKREIMALAGRRPSEAASRGCMYKTFSRAG